MKLTQQIADHLRQVHFGGSWTAANLKDKLDGVTWQQATTRMHSFHSIVALVYHMNYFVRAIAQVLEGGPLDAHDKYSFDNPPVASQEDWERMQEQVFADAQRLAGLIEQLPDERLGEEFVDARYGNWCRNLLGVIEHCHYHLGHIAVVKRALAERAASGSASGA